MLETKLINSYDATKLPTEPLWHELHWICELASRAWLLSGRTSVSKSVEGKEEAQWEEVKFVTKEADEPDRLAPPSSPARAFKVPSPRGQPSCHVTRLTTRLVTP